MDARLPLFNEIVKPGRQKDRADQKGICHKCFTVLPFELMEAGHHHHVRDRKYQQARTEAQKSPHAVERTTPALPISMRGEINA